MKLKPVLAVAVVLLVVGIALMAMPTPGKPDLECAAPSDPPSGLVIGDKGGCQATVESANEYADWSSGPRWDNIAGLVLVVAGLGTAGVAAVKSRRKNVAA